jgi:deazaflavin-dependent oxidoreductase (nitroreductase family)
MALMDRPPNRFVRAVLRMPIWLYRMRLGWLLGNRFLCIAHRGRRTGKTHHAVVEVVRFDRDDAEAFVIAGWGPDTQWYRNLEAAPAEKVIVGRHRWHRPKQRFLDEPARMSLLSSYAREHPRAAKELGRVFGLTGLSEEQIAELAERTRAVAFRESP